MCVKLDVPFFSCRGYGSQSEVWAAGQRMLSYANRGQQPYIIHLGDHDPSGIDMTRDIQDRMDLFTMNMVSVRRIALNMDQIQQYTPPPNPSKVTDPRAKDYQARYGTESWELDALEPSIMASLVEDAVLNKRDEALWAQATEIQNRQKAVLRTIAEEWGSVIDGLSESCEDVDKNVLREDVETLEYWRKAND